MQEIDIKKQPRMGLSRALTMTLHGIKYRLFRSFVTVMVIVVAVAFLMNILCESLIKRTVGDLTESRVAQNRLAVRWVSRLSQPGTIEELVRRLATLSADEPELREMQTMAGYADADMTSLHSKCQEAAVYLAFVTSLDYTQARQLFHRSRGTAIFNRLQDAAAWEQFASKLAELKSLRLPRPIEEFQAFVSEWPATKARIEDIRLARVDAAAKVTALLEGRSVIDALTDANGEFGEQIRTIGFALAEDTAAEVASLAKLAIELESLEESIGETNVRSSVASYLDLLPSQVDVRTMWKLLRSRGTTEWYSGKLKERLVELGDEGREAPPHLVRAAEMPVERKMELAKLRFRNDNLSRAEQLAAAVSGGIMGLGERLSWLLLVSMLVCMVGIANAMLMAVTERFREIATLKCLGALDETIMVMFVLEACLFGIVGGVLGAILGCVIGLGRMLALFGTVLFGAVPSGEIVVAMIVAVVLGVILAAVAAVYPSFKAARLAPMEAMRIE